MKVDIRAGSCEPESTESCSGTDSIATRIAANILGSTGSSTGLGGGVPLAGPVKIPGEYNRWVLKSQFEMPLSQHQSYFKEIKMNLNHFYFLPSSVFPATTPIQCHPPCTTSSCRRRSTPVATTTTATFHTRRSTQPTTLPVVAGATIQPTLCPTTTTTNCGCTTTRAATPPFIRRQWWTANWPTAIWVWHEIDWICGRTMGCRMWCCPEAWVRCRVEEWWVSVAFSKLISDGYNLNMKFMKILLLICSNRIQTLHIQHELNVVQQFRFSVRNQF